MQFMKQTSYFSTKAAILNAILLGGVFGLDGHGNSVTFVVRNPTSKLVSTWCTKNNPLPNAFACSNILPLKYRIHATKWVMGRIRGNSGYSRSIEEDRDSPLPSKSKAIARPGQKLSKWFKDENAWMISDASTRGPCDLIATFDFDGTLFRSPVRHFPGGCSFIAGVGGLYPPLVPRQPLADWFSEPVLRAVLERMATPTCRVVLLSGRPVDAGPRIAEILASQVPPYPRRARRASVALTGQGGQAADAMPGSAGPASRRRPRAAAAARC